MCKPMPYELLKFDKDMSNIKLENFVGLCIAEIETPNNYRAFLPYKQELKRIFPVGK